MDAAQVADALGAMAIIAVVAALAAGAGWAHAPTRERLRATVDAYAATSAWLVAAIAMAASLWFSESAGFPPCELCWYQRIAIYPLVVVLGVRALRRDGSRDLRLAGLLLVGAGLAVNLWHVAIETWPSLDTGTCDAAVPCTVRWVEGLDFFTIPRLATVVLGLVAALLLLDRSDVDRDRVEEGSPYDLSETPREGSAR